MADPCFKTLRNLFKKYSLTSYLKGRERQEKFLRDHQEEGKQAGLRQNSVKTVKKSLGMQWSSYFTEELTNCDWQAQCPLTLMLESARHCSQRQESQCLMNSSWELLEQTAHRMQKWEQKLCWFVQDDLYSASFTSFPPSIKGVYLTCLWQPNCKAGSVDAGEKLQGIRPCVSALGPDLVNCGPLFLSR